MEKNKKYIRKSFFPHQYEKEEEFLSKMAREGWQFVNLHYGIPTKYEFVKGEPVDYVYQLDYVNKDEDNENYHALFADAGWEEVFTWNGVYDGHWYYFRRIRSGDKPDRIFTDAESKYRMYDKLWKRYGLFFLMIFMLELNSFRMLSEGLMDTDLLSPGGIFFLFFFVLFVFLMIWFSYLVVGILIKRNQLRHMLSSRI